MPKRTAMIILGAAVLVGACSAFTPKPLRGEYPELAPQTIDPDRDIGQPVRWGGTIVEVKPREEDTCFEILGRPLTRNAAPQSVADTVGRFVACRRGFYDPQIFAPGRSLTVVGRLETVERTPVGKFDQPYPIVEASVVYLWPREDERKGLFKYYDPNLYDPYYDDPLGPTTGGDFEKDMERRQREDGEPEDGGGQQR